MNQISFSQNLISNGGFENNTAFPSSVAQWDRCVDWTNANLNTVSNPASPDYLHTSGFGNVQLPNSIFATISPLSGNAIMGFVTYHPSSVFREYLSNTLISPMKVGVMYKISFSLSSGQSNYYSGGSSDHIGVCLSTSPIMQISKEVINVLPQMEIQGNVWNTNWKTYSFSFVADSAYNHFTIGNFYDDNSTNVIYNVQGTSNASYYFIDEVSILPSGLQIIGNSVCLGDSVTLLGVNDISFSWADSLNPSTIISNDSSLTIKPTVNSTYFLYGTNDTVSFTVNVENPLSVSLSNDTTLCLGTTMSLDATTNDASYLWQDGSTSPSYIVSQSGTYKIDLTNSCGTVSDEIKVYYESIPDVDLGNDTTLCDLAVFPLNSFGPNGTNLWQDGSDSSIYYVTNQGSYWLEVSNICGIASDSIDIEYISIQDLDLGNDTTLCKLDTLILDATTPNALYQWQDYSYQPTFEVTEKGIYTVTVLVDICLKQDTIIVDEVDCNVALDMPNIFTPNGDGLNDVFTPISIKAIESINTTIYNRWGIKVFESNDLNIGWDGQNVSAGVFFWVVTYTNINKKRGRKNGFVQVVK